jgi:crotonobetainyl-CoA:carnitine CoA-transferase CaiB-like acyl-CoA transferase
MGPVEAGGVSPCWETTAMRQTEPVRRLRSVPLLPDLPVTVVGRGQAARTGAEILRVLGAEVRVVDASALEINAEELAGDALVVCDLVEYGATPSYLAAVAGRPRGAWVTVSAFGLDGPKGGEAGSDLVCAAAGGLLQCVTDPGGGVHPIPGSQALRVAGQAAALAALHALSLVRSGQEPLHLDLSVQEAVAYCAIPQPAASVLYEAGLLEGRGFGAPQGRLPCADGALSILVIDDHQWNRLVEAMGRPAWTEPYSQLEVRRARRDEIQDAVAAWTRTRSKFDCERILQAHGVAACAERTLADVVSNEQFLERDFLGPGDDAHLSCATLPALITPLASIDGAVDASARTLERLRIAEITNVLAGPLAGATLAAMGATSVRFEEPQRLDLYRRNGPFQSGVPGLERAAFYLFGNFSKRNVSRRVGSDPEFSAAVNVWADLVLENVGASRLERLGLAPPAGADKTLISMSGFGRTGPAAAYKAYAGNAAAFAGIAGAVRELSDPRAVGGSLFPDCKSALWAATLAAAWWLGGAQPYLFDLSMAEVVASDLNGLPLEVTSSPPPEVAPDLIMRCADGSVAVAIGSRLYPEALAAVGLGESEVPIWRSYAEAVADLTGTSLTVDTVVQSLGTSGFSAYRALGTAEVVRDSQLEARGFIVRLEHPEVGISPIFALPWKVAGTRRDAAGGWYRRSKLLGEDDDWFDQQLAVATSGT